MVIEWCDRVVGKPEKEMKIIIKKSFHFQDIKIQPVTTR